jgi:hypothetical protein
MKMKMKKRILGIVGECIKKYGFEFSDAGSLNWIFARKTDNPSVTQKIEIIKNRFVDTLHMRFYTTENFLGTKAMDIIPKGQYSNNDVMKSIKPLSVTSSEEEVLEFHREFVLLVEKYGYKGIASGWHYENEEDFEKALHEFVDIIEKYGLDELERLSAGD